MEDINKYLNDDASEEERAAVDRLSEGFTALRIKGKVKAAAAARAKRQQRNNIIGLVLLLLTLFLAVWLWFAKGETVTPPLTTEDVFEQESTSPPVPGPIEEEPVIDVEEEVLPEAPREEAPAPPVREIPIASAELPPPPPYGAPDTYLRGQSEQKEGKELLDQLWYTGYPLTGLKPTEAYLAVDELLRERTFTTAYVRLQRLDRQLPPNDTLRYLQAYTLLEMGQGPEALTLLDQLETPPFEWLPQVEWYRGLASLLAGEEAKALAIFEKITKKINHPYKLQAKKALSLYQ
ncbi:tetratricopeptide repeat protein [Lewinella cohaerens]|uniref:tetratricopeptide repeat protein n=1 Tax=Lewinella cohaerens TaxID=70995 RepID=UPI000376E6FF|nr:tetratricopeptide repeat protein [Lewinella cohaerens]